MKKAIATALIALGAVTALTVPLPCRTEAGIEQERKRQIDIELVTENEGYEFSPGETVQVDTKVKNNGTDLAHIFVRAENPADVYTYHVAEGWDEIEPGVYYGGVLEPDQTTSELLKEIRVHDYGEVSQERLEAIGEAARDFRVQGRAIMLMKHGTPEQMWEMIGG